MKRVAEEVPRRMRPEPANQNAHLREEVRVREGSRHSCAGIIPIRFDGRRRFRPPSQPGSPSSRCGAIRLSRRAYARWLAASSKGAVLARFSCRRRGEKPRRPSGYWFDVWLCGSKLLNGPELDFIDVLAQFLRR